MFSDYRHIRIKEDHESTIVNYTWTKDKSILKDSLNGETDINYIDEIETKGRSKICSFCKTPMLFQHNDYKIITRSWHRYYKSKDLHSKSAEYKKGTRIDNLKKLQSFMIESWQYFDFIQSKNNHKYSLGKLMKLDLERKTDVNYLRDIFKEFEKYDNIKSIRNDLSLSVASICVFCGYWQVYFRSDDYNTLEWNLIVPDQIQFNTLLPECYTADICRFLIRNNKYYETIDPIKFEKVSAEILKYNYGYSDVKHIGGPGDNGIDYYLINSDKSQKDWIVQVKRRSKENHVEGVSTIRAFLGTLVDTNNQYGAIVSTAKSFSKAAKEMVARNTKKGFYINLIDRQVLKEILAKNIDFKLPNEILFSNKMMKETIKSNPYYRNLFQLTDIIKNDEKAISKLREIHKMGHYKLK